MKRILLAVSLALALGIPGATSAVKVAHADPGNGSAINQTTCQPIDGTGATQCVTIKAEQNITMTPSGKTNAEANGTVTLTVTYNGMTVFTETEDLHYHALWQNGMLQETGQRIVLVATFDNTTCSLVMDVHYANGQIQYNRSQPPTCS